MCNLCLKNPWACAFWWSQIWPNMLRPHRFGTSTRASQNRRDRKPHTIYSYCRFVKGTSHKEFTVISNVRVGVPNSEIVSVKVIRQIRKISKLSSCDRNGKLHFWGSPSLENLSHGNPHHHGNCGKRVEYILKWKVFIIFPTATYGASIVWPYIS